MDATTWQDDRVVSWIRTNGLASRLDVDKHPEHSQRFRVNAMPTMIAFQHGLETHRIVGYRGPEEMLTWLREVRTGVVHPAHAGGRLGTGERQGVKDRLNRARTLFEQGDHEEAAEEFLWLWNNMVKQEPAMRGVRRSLMAADMTNLAAASRIAKTAFRAQRNKTEEELDEDHDALLDWIVLNRVVADEQKTLAWVDRQLPTDDGRHRVVRSAFLLDDVLERHGRWDALASIWPDPAARVVELAFWLEPERLEYFRDDPSMLAAVRADYEKQFRTGIAKLFTTYVAIKDDQRASELMRLARDELSSPRLIVDAIKHATTHRQVAPAMRSLLDEAARSPTADRDAISALRREVDRMLQAGGS